MQIRRPLRSAAQIARLAVLLAVERAHTGAVFVPFGRRFHADPYSQYARLRERDPLHRSVALQGWVFSRYAEVHAILRDPRFSNDTSLQPGFGRVREDLIAAGVVDPAIPRVSNLLELDPPEHTRLRTLVSKAFTPRAVERMLARAEAIVDEQLDAVAARGEMDVIRDLATPLPVIVIAEMLGIPSEDRERLKHWSNEMVLSVGAAGFSNRVRSARAGNEFREYLEALGAERRREPRDDLLSALLAAEEEGDRLSEAEVYMMIGLLMIAGNETTTNLIGNGTLALLRNPEQLARLRDDPERIAPTAVEELLRYDSPVQATARYPREDFEFAGMPIRRGQVVVVLLASANRDEAQFEHADRLDVGRADNRHLSFGQGVHFCLGAQLARMEARIALSALVRRFPDLRLATDDVEWRANTVLRGLRALPVRV